MENLRSRVQESLTGTHVIDRELGGGGMSRVFVANELALGRSVVIKVLSPELSAAMSATRFEREIRVAASLQQANIVPVLSAGEIDGLPYYTMPYVDGESLRARLGRGPLAIAEVVSILRDVSRALAYAHERGVVHRDIKPDNVLLSGHTAVVTDFGIAKAIAVAATDTRGTTLTQFGTAVGTPAYMAPEQAAGDPATDQRADIYAFGCMAYELLAAQAPFAGLPPQKLLAAHMSETPRPVAELRTDCPPALASLVMQCMEKDPNSRPANAPELLHRLDAGGSSSVPQATTPAMLIGGRSMLLRALAVYVVAFVGVAILARTAIVAIGLPDWVFPGALAVMALGLPMILFTAYTQYLSRRLMTATPTVTPGGTSRPAAAKSTMATLAIRVSPHVSWRLTVRRGIFALGAFALLVAGYMLLRMLGIGPAGSLLAAGKLSESDRVIVAAFDAGADFSLGETIGEALRTNLSQSRAVRVMQMSAIVAALEQMQRPDTTRVDFATAREIAQRTGAKAVVAGSVVPANDGYILTVRLIATESGNELASYRESASDAGGLIPAVDRLTKSLRERVGESLKSVRAAPRLEQVTTASLDALRNYAAGMHANDIEGDSRTAIQYYDNAIAKDSAFAMAYVQLAYSLTSLGGADALARADSALATAFRLRDRLPERERYNVEGAYYMGRGDRRQAIAAFQRAVALDSTNYDAINSLGVVLDETRDYAGAERMYRLALAGAPNGTTLMNLALVYVQSGQHAAFDSVIAVLDSSGVPYSTAPVRFAELWNQRDYDAAERIARAVADTGRPDASVIGQFGLVHLAVLRGRLHEAERRYARTNDAAARVLGRQSTPYDAVYFRATLEGELRGHESRAVSMIDSVLREVPLETVPVDRDYSPWLALAYSRLGVPAKARALLRQHTARLDSVQRRQEAVIRARLNGTIALAEGKTDSAIAWFRRSEIGEDGLPMNDCTVCTPLFVGFAFDRAGQADSARAYLVRYVDMPGSARAFIDRFYLAPALFRLGELFENIHDTPRATEYYGRFVDLWKNADPELQPRVAEVRARIEQLNRGVR